MLKSKNSYYCLNKKKDLPVFTKNFDRQIKVINKITNAWQKELLLFDNWIDCAKNLKLPYEVWNKFSKGQKAKYVQTLGFPKYWTTSVCSNLSNEEKKRFDIIGLKLEGSKILQKRLIYSDMLAILKAENKKKEIMKQKDKIAKKNASIAALTILDKQNLSSLQFKVNNFYNYHSSWLKNYLKVSTYLLKAKYKNFKYKKLYQLKNFKYSNIIKKRLKNMLKKQLKIELKQKHKTIKWVKPSIWKYFNYQQRKIFLKQKSKSSHLKIKKKKLYKTKKKLSYFYKAYKLTKFFWVKDLKDYFFQVLLGQTKPKNNSFKEINYKNVYFFTTLSIKLNTIGKVLCVKFKNYKVLNWLFFDSNYIYLNNQNKILKISNKYSTIYFLHPDNTDKQTVIFLKPKTFLLLQSGIISLIPKWEKTKLNKTNIFNLYVPSIFMHSSVKKIMKAQHKMFIVNSFHKNIQPKLKPLTKILKYNKLLENKLIKNKTIKKFNSRLKKLFLKRYRYMYTKEYYKVTVFRKFFKKKFSRFRHINKNRLFIELFRGHFKSLTTFSEKELISLWSNFKRGTNKYWGYTNLVQKFSQSILLMPQHLVLILNLAPSLSAAKTLVKFGGVVINGLTSVNLNYFTKPGDIVQFTPKLWSLVKKMFNYQQWYYYRLKLNYLAFMQIDWSMLLFTIVHWPYNYELIAPSFLSERWVRYYIRQFPVRTRKYQKVKTVWKKYLNPKRNRK